MRIAIVRNGKELAERAFVEIRKVLAEKPDAVIGFATGATPVPLYEKMADDHKKNGTSYKRVRAFNLDEYVGVDKNDKASFARFMRDNLFSKIDIDPANTDIPNGMAEDLSAECERYSAMVKANPADIQILGIGENGHIHLAAHGEHARGERGSVQGSVPRAAIRLDDGHRRDPDREAHPAARDGGEESAGGL